MHKMHLSYPLLIMHHRARANDGRQHARLMSPDLRHGMNLAIKHEASHFYAFQEIYAFNHLAMHPASC